jgi:hypothetical protein
LSAEIAEYTLNPSIVLAVQLTPENIYEVAEWCGGRILQVKSHRIEARPPEGLSLRIQGGITRQVAFGEYIIKNDVGWAVYSEERFQQNHIRRELVFTVSQ